VFVKFLVLCLVYCSCQVCWNKQQGKEIRPPIFALVQDFCFLEMEHDSGASSSVAFISELVKIILVILYQEISFCQKVPCYRYSVYASCTIIICNLVTKLRQYKNVSWRRCQ
jgi:hypothetical protein